MRYFLLAALLFAPVQVRAQVPAGPVEVIDGDSLSVAATPVRLFGIDAPEGAQTCNRAGSAWACGEEAANKLRNMIGGSSIACRGKGIDAFGRTLSVCSVAGIELNRAMVEAGWATAFRRYSMDYVAEEARAKAVRKGIWGSEFQLPEEFRAAQTAAREVSPNTVRRQLQPSMATRTMSGCAIKGNRNRKRQWIYHLPGMPYYPVTRAEEMFCSEADALAAGYRRAIVR